MVNGKKTANYERNQGIVTLVLCFLVIFLCLGFAAGNRGLYLSAITDALGIKRSLFSINDSVRYVMTAVVNLFFGRLVARYGSRKLLLAGIFSLILSTFLYMAAESIWVFYLGGLFLGIGLAWTTTTMVGYVVGRWYSERRGTIMGVVLAANGLGATLAAQVVSPMIYDPENVFGYRNAYRLIIVLLGIVFLLVFLLYRDKEEPESAAPAGKKKRGRQWAGISFEEARRRPYFYIALLAVFLTGMMLQSITGVAPAHLRDTGFAPSFVAAAMSINMLALTAAKLFTGWAYDRRGLRFVLLFCQSCAVAAVLLLIFVKPASGGRVMTYAYAVAASFALPMETVMLPIIAGDLFGDRSYAKIMGIVVSVNTAGYAVGTPLTNWVFDRTGSYVPMFWAFAGIILASAVLYHAALGMAHRAPEFPKEDG